MFLIGIHGGVGAGKSSLLQRLAEWWRTQGKVPEGFVAIAEGRQAGARGADRYDLLMLNRGAKIPYAVREPSQNPPYRFSPEATDSLERWADSLAAGPSPSLVVIDEFGPREAAGEGHVHLWDRVLQAKPEIVVAAVREGLEEQIESRIGSTFEVMIEAGTPEAWESLRQACVEHSDWMRVGLFGGGAGGFEASVGAVLHGSQIPLRGLFLSSMQSVILTYAGDGMGRRRRLLWVALIAASLKALSPAGNRVRPMLAITLQGVQYVLAIVLLGWNVLGVAVAGFLVGAWSAIQGIALQYVFVGDELLRAYDSIVRWLAEKLALQSVGLFQLMAGWTLFCGAVSATFTLLAWKHRRRMPGRLRDLMFRKPVGVVVDWRPVNIAGAVRRGLQDIARPLFWLPVVIVIGVMMASGSPWASMLWVVFRAAAVGFVLFSVVRSFDLHRFIAWLQHRGHWGPALAFRRALDRMSSPMH